MPDTKSWDRKPLRLRELLARLRKFDVEAIPRRGKGSEIILLRPTEPGSRRGPQYPIKNHGEGTEITLPVIKACLRQLGIPEDEFWSA
jgi:hypothetical protein